MPRSTAGTAPITYSSFKCDIRNGLEEPASRCRQHALFGESEMPRSLGRRWAIATSTVTLSALAISAAIAQRQQLHTGSTPASVAPSPSASTLSSPSVARLDELSDAFATIAAKIKPSVVYITARQAAQPVSRRSRGPWARGQTPALSQLPPELRQFFRDMPGTGDSDADPMPHGGGVASGSGFIVSNDGY